MCKTLRATSLLPRLAIGVLAIYGSVTIYVTLGPLLGFPPTRIPTTLFLTVLAWIFALSHAWVILGRLRVLILLALTFTISLLFESVGVATGWIYGPYHYTDALGPKFMGLVPYLIPLAWFMMIYPSQVIAEGFLLNRVPNDWRGEVGIAFTSAIIMTSWDVVMDPMMVRFGFWEWEVEGAFFGVPLQNYGGWILTTFCIFLIYRWITNRLGRGGLQHPTKAFVKLAALSYLLSWLGSSFAALQVDLFGPFLAGAFSAGSFGVIGMLTAGEERRLPLDSELPK